MLADGIRISQETKILSFQRMNDESTEVKVKFRRGQSLLEEEEVFDVVLFATGRKPNIDNIGCDKAGVQTAKDGVVIDNFMRTTNPSIYSCGDCVPGPNFTHNSDVQARLVVRNALFFGSDKRDQVILPYCTYTDPEVASVGMNEDMLKSEGIQYDTYAKHFEHNDRAICESAKGLYKIHTRRGTDEILGATLVGGPAGDLIGQVTCAMFNKMGLQKMGACVYPYPTYAESFR